MHSYRHMDPKWILDTVENYIERLKNALDQQNYEIAREYTEEALGILQHLEHQLWQRAKVAAKAELEDDGGN